MPPNTGGVTLQVHQDGEWSHLDIPYRDALVIKQLERPDRLSEILAPNAAAARAELPPIP